MVGRDGVAENTQRARAGDRLDRAGSEREVGEERRLLDVGRFDVERVDVTRGRGDFVPLRILFGEVRVEPAENFRFERGLHLIAHFLERGPDVFEEHRRAGLITTEWLNRQIQVHPTREREGHHERRRHQEVGLDVLVDAGLEVAVAREHGGSDEVVLHDRFFDRSRERAGVSDTRRAAVADRLETELIKVRRQTGLFQIVRDDARTGRERGFDEGIYFEALRDGLLGEQAGREHHARVGSVGAAGDGGNQNGTVAELRATDFSGDGRKLFGFFAKTIFRNGLREGADKLLLHLRELDAILRALRTGDARPHGREIEREIRGIFDFAFLRNAPEALRLVVSFVGGDLFFIATRGAEIIRALGVDREKAHGRTVFGRHVGDHRAIYYGERGRARAVELDELADNLRLAELLR